MNQYIIGSTRYLKSTLSSDFLSFYLMPFCLFLFCFILFVCFGFKILSRISHYILLSCLRLSLFLIPVQVQVVQVICFAERPPIGVCFMFPRIIPGLWTKGSAQPTLKKWQWSSTSLRMKYLHKWFGILFCRTFVPSSSFIQLFLSAWTHEYLFDISGYNPVLL